MHQVDTSLFGALPVQPPVREPGAPRPRRLPAPRHHPHAPAWPLDGAVNVVLFAGLGGACQGLERAGFPVHVAVNHDKVAIAAHKALNPHTRHLQADIYEVCPLEATRRRPANILWASPDCRDHSVAKGGAPRSPRVRSMPWQVCRWVGTLRRHGLGPNTVYLENVREIRGWGPLIAKRDKATGRVMKVDGTVAAKGERVARHEQMLIRDPARAGRTYRAWVRHMERLGASYQDRDLNCADYGIPTSRKRLFGVAVFDGRPITWPTITHAPRRSAAVQAGTLAPYRAAADIIDWSLPLPSIFDRPKPLVAATHKRLAVGVRRYVIDAGDGAFLTHLTHHQDGRPPLYKGEPLPTITGAHRGEIAVAGAAVVPTTHTRDAGRIHDGRDPVPTVTAGVKRGELGISAAYMVQTGYGERAGQAPRALDVEEPIGTQVAGGAKHAVAAAWMVQHNSGVTGHDMREPVSTMTAGSNSGFGGAQQQPAAAFLVKQRGTTTAADMAGPAPSLTTGGNKGGDHVGVSAAFLAEYYGTGGQHQDAADPLNTLSTRDRFGPTRADLAAPPLSPEILAKAKRVADFLREYGTWTGGDLVTVRIGAANWIIVDIGMRMLRPHEAAAAHGLEMPAEIEIGGVRRSLNKTEGMRLIGNSVPPAMAELLATANSNHTLAPRIAAE